MHDVEMLRRQFPALQQLRDGVTPIFLDGPGGTQVPQRVIDAISQYLSSCNANCGGAFVTSRETDEVLANAHVSVADLLNAPSPDEIVFGANMTTLTFHFTRAIAATLKRGDEVMVTRLDHDANITPWTTAARDAGAVVRWVDVHPEDCTLNIEDFKRQLNERTRWVAVTAASNAVGTLTNIPAIAELTQQAGTRLFVDAVHYAPHGPIDVQRWNCDALACSAYKFFGPHVGVLWAKRECLEQLPAYKLRPAPDSIPGRWMTGTQNHEGLAGVTATVEYLDAVAGSDANLEPHRTRFAKLSGRRLRLHAAMAMIQNYERRLAGYLLEQLAERPRFKVWGVTDRDRLSSRAPTISITTADRHAKELADHLAAHHIYVWHGNVYAVALVEKLGLAPRGGFLRLGLVHYNTREEIERLLAVLDRF